MILLLFAPISGTYIWMNYQKKTIKREVKENIISKLQKSDLVQLTFNHDNISVHWENDHEFEYEGRMYDIVDISIEENTITYWCWIDHEETALNNQLNEILTIALLGNKDRNNKAEMLNNFLKALPLITFNEQALTFDQSRGLSTYTPELLIDNILSVPSPPPDLC